MNLNTENYINPLDIVKYGDISMDCSRFEITVKGQMIHLTQTEYNLLSYLIQYHYKAVSREELLKNIWNIDQVIETRATDDMIKRLRKKLKIAQSNVSILTVRGFGFIISLKEKTEASESHYQISRSEIPTFIDLIIDKCRDNGQDILNLTLMLNDSEIELYVNQNSTT